MWKGNCQCASDWLIASGIQQLKAKHDLRLYKTVLGVTMLQWGASGLAGNISLDTINFCRVGMAESVLNDAMDQVLKACNMLMIRCSIL
jgi:hypothetical protein